MQRRLFWKALMVAGLALALLIPLSMIEGQVEARNRRQGEVRADVAALSAGPQQVTGPLLVLSYEELVAVEERNEKTGEVTRRTRIEARHRVIVPRELSVVGQAAVDPRHRGLFKTQAYDLDARVSGTFVVPKDSGLGESRGRVQPGRATLVVGLSDLRGIRKRPVLAWEGRSLEFLPGAIDGVLCRGIHADLGPMASLEGREFPFALPLALKGTQTLSFTPVAEATRVALRSPWPTPSFQGRFAAVHHEGPQGFEATWEVFHLARNLDRILEAKGDSDESFGVAFLEGVNVYLRAERAVKYGFLFVGITFAAFFFFEMLRRLPIHPIQYFLVGLALAFFFLLLLSLSEHVPFEAAYGLASLACIGLLGAYLVHVLRNRALGLGFAGGLVGVYGVLYGLLVLEDAALLMGSLVLFAGLAAVMLGTRRVDWYGLGEGKAESPATLDA